MRPIIFLSLLLLPAAVSGQKIEFSALAGYSHATIISHNMTGDGASFRLAAGYRVLKHVSVSAFYGHNKWDGGPYGTRATSGHSFGLSPEFTAKHFFAGADIYTSLLSAEPDAAGPATRYKSAWGYGLHAGLQQKIWGRLCLTEQIGYQVTAVKGQLTYPTPEMPLNSGGGWCIVGPLGEYAFSGQISYISAHVGLSYRL